MQYSPRGFWQVSTLIVLTSCRPSFEVNLPKLDPNEPNCPNIAVIASGDTVIHMRDTINVPLAGITQDIPEYHDCQRLISESTPPTPAAAQSRPLRYGPLVGVWARIALGSIPVSEYQTGTPVAELFSWDGPYGSLGIQKGYNCLYLRGDTNGMEARMRPIGSDSVCTRTLTPTEWNAATRLQVRLVRKAPPIPAVARWDIDRQGRQYIGLLCLDHWCEVGPGGFTSSPDLTGGNREDVKGWYDEQSVGDYAGSLLAPSYHAQIVPYPELDTYTVEDFRCDPCNHPEDWKRAAYVLLNAGPGKYTSRYGFKRGRNEVALRFNVPLDRWEARIQPPMSLPITKRVLRVPHEGLGIHVPGTARWRWLPNDETTWMRCGDACCTVN